MTYEARVIDYYRRSSWLYKTFWYSPDSLGLHYGFWTKGTKTHDEAIINQYEDVIKKGKIKTGQKVLDTGCGVGGGAIYIADKTGARVTGITLVKEQVEEARKMAKRRGVTELVDFVQGDYTKTNFPDNTFDTVYGIESICYAYPKSAFLKEAYRILKPGGRLVVNDGYCRREPRTAKEKAIIRNFCRGWRLKELAVVSEMTKEIRKARFKNVEIEDMTEVIKPSLRQMERLSKIAYLPAKIGTSIRLPWLATIADNVLSMRMSIEGIRIGLGGYFSHTAEKLKN